VSIECKSEKINAIEVSPPPSAGDGKKVLKVSSFTSKFAFNSLVVRFYSIPEQNGFILGTNGRSPNRNS